MKKILLPILFLLLFYGSLWPAAAAGMSDLSDMEGLAEGLPEGFFDQDISLASEAVEKASDPSFLWSYVYSRVAAGFPEAVSLFAKILGFLLLSSVLRLWSGEEKTAQKAMELCLGVVLISLVLTDGGGEWEQLTAYFDHLSLLMNLMLPLTGVLYAMGGNVRTAVVNNGGFSLLLWTVEHLCADTIQSFVGIGTALTLGRSLAPESGVGGVLRLVKKNYTMFLGGVMMLLCFSLSVQTSLAAAADSIAMRGAKLLAGSAIPVVGGSVGETVKTVSSGLSLLKNTVGWGGILLVAFLLLPPLLSLWLRRAAVSAAVACAEMLGCGEEKKILEGMGDIYGFVLACMTICSIAVILFLAVFVKCEIAM